MSRLTPERLAEIEAREKAATEGPWSIRPRDLRYYPNSDDKPVVTQEMVLAEHPDEFLGCELIGTDKPGRSEYTCRDGWFIANARQDIPDLLAYVRKLEAVVDAAKSVLSEEGVKEFLSAYVMGTALIDRCRALDKEAP